MEQAEQVRQQGRFRAWTVRLLHSRRAVWRFGLLAVAGWVQFFAFLALAMVIAAFQVIFFHQEQPSSPQFLFALALSVIVALAATIYIHRTHKASFFDPPKKRIPERDGADPRTALELLLLSLSPIRHGGCGSSSCWLSPSLASS
jgi:hypothetical protein